MYYLLCVGISSEPQGRVSGGVVWWIWSDNQRVDRWNPLQPYAYSLCRYINCCWMQRTLYYKSWERLFLKGSCTLGIQGNKRIPLLLYPSHHSVHHCKQGTKDKCSLQAILCCYVLVPEQPVVKNLSCYMEESQSMSHIQKYWLFFITPYSE